MAFPVERAPNMKTTGHILYGIVIYLQCSTWALSHHSTLEEAKQINASPARKYKKKLRKEEGAIRLVGGSNEYEGMWLLQFRFLVTFFISVVKFQFIEMHSKHMYLKISFETKNEVIHDLICGRN